jgi:hypothetical protein
MAKVLARSRDSRMTTIQEREVTDFV